MVSELPRGASGELSSMANAGKMKTLEKCYLYIWERYLFCGPCFPLAHQQNSIVIGQFSSRSCSHRAPAVERLYCKRPILCLASSRILTPHPFTDRRVSIPRLWCGGRTHSLAGWRGGQYFGRRQTQLCNLHMKVLCGAIDTANYFYFQSNHRHIGFIAVVLQYALPVQGIYWNNDENSLLSEMLLAVFTQSCRVAIHRFAEFSNKYNFSNVLTLTAQKMAIGAASKFKTNRGFYALKKGQRFSRPLPGCHFPNSPWIVW